MPRTGNSMQDPSLLMAALEGLQLQKHRIEEQIQEVRSLLGRKGSGRAAMPAGSAKQAPIASAVTKRGRLSPAARKRIAAAQKRRWAEYRKSANKSE